MSNELKELEALQKAYGVYHKGKIAMYVNPTLVLNKHLKPEDVERIKKLHEVRLLIFDFMETTTDKILLKLCAKVIENLEFALQKAWNFPKDKKCHSWWYQVPHCNCPRLDNQDRFGTDQRVINETCPVHS